MLASPLQLGTRRRVAGGWLAGKLHRAAKTEYEEDDPDAVNSAPNGGFGPGRVGPVIWTVPLPN